ncbi:acyl-CoA synthetase [Natronomonas marina]|uniref:acyl-CoA synthetase n=1 Tax=Natronomonas marina TaxID=2961939 RepID=UPI0020C9EF5B|nr:AMP-binding protein [Natronomonas marina]
MQELPNYDLHEQEWDSYEQLYGEFEWVIPDQFNMAEWACDRWADSDGERDAAYFEDAAGNQTTYTFSRLQTEANQLANLLSDRGVGRGDRVGVDGSPTPEVLVTHVAIQKLGAVVVPLSARFGPDGLQYRLEDSGAKAYVTGPGNIETLRTVRDDVDDLQDVFVTSGIEPAGDEISLTEAMEGASTDFETVETEATDNALIIYTSGTTGDPKGVVHTHELLLGHLPLFSAGFCNLELHEDDVFRIPTEWSWLGSLFALVMPALYYGRPVVGYHGEFDPEVEFELIEEYDVSVNILPNTILRMMAQVPDAEERFDLSSIRTIPTGGEALDQSAWEWAVEVFGDVIIQSYGQTEANMLLGNFPSLKENRPETLGLPAPGHEIRIVDPETAEPTVDTGEIGEIAVRYGDDPVCFKEYWKKPDKTAGKVKDGWLITEDLGFRDEDGYFQFKSRKDDVIISSGYRIGPDEVEDYLGGHEAVADAGVIGVPHEERSEVPKAFVVLLDGYEPSEGLRKDLQSYVKDGLAAYEYPRELEFVDELPRTSTGKLRRTDLREREGIEG